jgi:hypothetical protein
MSAWARDLWARTREFVTLRDLEARVQARSAPQRERVAHLVERAEEHARAARILSPSDTPTVATRTAFDAAVLYALALRAEQASTPSDAEDDALDAPRSQPEAQALLEERTAALGLHLEADLHAEGPTTEAGRRYRTYLDLADTFAQHLDHKAPRDVAIMRSARRIGFALLALLCLKLAWSTLTRGHNLAREAHASASSRFAQTPDPSGVNNGTIEGTFGVHTTKERDAWVGLDLGKERTIREVRVYARGDGFASESLPLALEVSHDGVSFELLERRDLPFTQALPWVFRGEVSARHLRVRHIGEGYVALAELEVYGR